MFKTFSRHKTGYNKGQVFPFLIAIICVVIILIMITVNLGQMGVFRTDVSDAADAGALAGVSVLSGSLLGLGLKSDMMCGESVVCLTAAAILCYTAYFWGGIAILISSFISQLCACLEAMEDATMCWTNAKKTAVQYAFNNAGVDEPRPNFGTFLKNAYNISDIKKDLTDSEKKDIKKYYVEYQKGESDKFRKYGRPGFSSFIEDDENGYWKEGEFGKIGPGEMSEVLITSGYGWEQKSNEKTFEETFYNSDNNPNPGKARYDLYKNYVEVTTTGAPIYALDIYGIQDNGFFKAEAIAISFSIFVCVARYVASCIPWPWGAIIGILVGAIVGLLVYKIMQMYPMGLKMMNEDKQYEGNPITMTVKRHKGEENLGLWKFHYGTIEAKAKAHVYREHIGDPDNEETIEPCFGEELKKTFHSLSTVWKKSWFKKTKHLFEVKLISAN